MTPYGTSSVKSTDILETKQNFEVYIHEENAFSFIFWVVMQHFTPK